MDSAIFSNNGQLVSMQMYGDQLKTVTSYYYFGGQRVAMRTPTDGVQWLHSDHLGSSSTTTTNTGGVHAWMRYKPFGEVRTSGGTLPTNRKFNGNVDDGFGTLHYGAREYSPLLGRFLSADTIVPGAGNPQALNRYSYVFNNPLGYTDPSGHDPFSPQWDEDFEKATGRQAESFDRMLYLFSIAFPDEYKWNLQSHAFRSRAEAENFAHNLFQTNVPDSRSWSNFASALDRLASNYTDSEQDIFVRDIASLFAGMSTRWELPNSIIGNTRTLNRQDVHGNGRVWLSGNGGPSRIVDTDPDANVHHWAAFVLNGYMAGAVIPQIFNTGREIRQAQGPGRSANMQDVRIGNYGAAMGMRQSWVAGATKPSQSAVDVRKMIEAEGQ